MNNTYYDYINAFSSISKDEKKKEILKKSKELEKILSSLSNDNEVLLPSDIEDLEISPIDDDYYQAVYAHLIYLEYLVSKYLDKTIDK